MPYTITKTSIREIDPDDCAQHAQLLEELDMRLEQYLQQSPPRTMPLMGEREFGQKKFLKWSSEQINTKYPDAHFRYAIVDHEFEPLNDQGKKITFPVSFISLFEYKGKTYAGPLVAGVLPNILQAKGKGHPETAINLEEPYASIFTAENQQRIAQQAIEALCNHPSIDGAMIAIPNRRLGATQDLRKSAFFHLLVGGKTTDQHTPEAFEFLEEPRGINPLRSNPISFLGHITRNTDPDNNYIIFPFLKHDQGELLRS